MIPVRLTIQGLYSFREKQVVDFERLAEGQLFGIFGPVGSGKSSLLEAMTLALYGESERLNKQDRRNYNMLNLRSDKLYVEFDFRAQGNQLYRFTTEINRSKKDFDTVGTPERYAYKYNAETGDFVPLDSNDGEKVTGLSYDNFRLAIIIPQGKFSDFLAMEGKARTQTMKELFHLDRFELLPKLKTVEETNRASQHELEGRLKQLPDVSDEMLEEQEILVFALESDMQRISSELDDLHARESALKILHEKFRQMEAAQAEYSALKEQLPRTEEREKQLRLFENVRRDFRPLLEKELTLQVSRRKASETLAIADAELEKATAEADAAERNFSEMRTAYESRDEIALREREMNILLHALPKAEELKRLESKRVEAQDAQFGFETKQREKRDQIGVNQDELEMLKRNSGNPTDLAELSKWFAEKKQFQENISTTQDEVKALEKEIKEFDARKEKMLISAPKQSGLSAGHAMLPPSEIVPLLEAALTRLGVEEEKMRRDINLMEIQERIADIARNLRQGEACPLCGSTEHPSLYHSGDSLKPLETLRKKLRETEEARERIREIRSDSVAIAAQLHDRTKRVQKARENLEMFTSRFKKHYQLFRWPDYLPDEESKLIRVLEFSRTVRDNIASLEEKIGTESANLEALNLNLEKNKQLLGSLDRQIANLAGEVNNARNSLKILNWDEFAHKYEGEISRLAVNLKKEYETIGDRHKQAQEKRDKAREKQQAARTRYEVCRRDDTVARESQEQLVQEFSRYLNLLQIPSREAMEEIYNRPVNVEAERAELQRFRTSFQAVEERLSRLSSELKDQRYEKGVLEKIVEQVTTLRSKQTETNQKIGMEKAALELQRSQRTERAGLSAELNRIRERASDLAVLRQLFTASGFVDYVSTVYLLQLCRSANERFRKLTRNKLSLELDDKNSFVVRDFLNGGQLRSIKTLSGGQTFQAALSLALALSDNIQSQSGQQQNFFFLDEGFGTLDKDSLQVVFETLISLRREKRIVGIISHVEELRQEIDTCLHIHQDEERGSVIRGIWERVAGVAAS